MAGNMTHPSDDPFSLFDQWFAQAKANEPNDPNAMTLSTSNIKGRPSARIVLLKKHGPEGFIFFTNTHSRKGQDIDQNANAALLFHWKSQRRQIRIEGALQQVSDALADSYFATRQRDSQIGAWASDQSQPLADRKTFETRIAHFDQQFAGQDVPRPPHWSGYCLTPDYMEFWQDREHRLHDRWVFSRSTTGWTQGLLYP